jgi:hypothetical protein
MNLKALGTSTILSLLLSGCTAIMGNSQQDTSQDEGSNQQGKVSFGNEIETDKACQTLTATQPSIDRLSKLSKCYLDYSVSLGNRVDLKGEREELIAIQSSLNDLAVQTESIQGIYCSLQERCIVEVTKDQAIFNDYYQIASRIQQMNEVDGDPKRLSRVIKTVNAKIKDAADKLASNQQSEANEMLTGISVCSGIATQK